ncbi:copper resistance CopC family protein [Actinoplanes utahensis]|uniref:CopC domain-containing protein n=1 Tax=Actinoplanes utahensis TaxID=1869 RepID=A0A0A6XGN5_ACTUT|nr:copper resistance CopC family protein [Actinoplanes utahensis]KHD79257.1 hypothetical protein MB27_01200 [Actinoplanes utahensis]GIF30315.1 hypothetical protein Aut01nite_33010 [Actinoplanes utahensis]
MTRTLLALAAVLLVLVPGAPAWAHNALAEASPAKNATLKESPREVKLRFLQKLDPKYTTITVSGAAKATMGVSAPKVDGATGVVTVQTPLANGVYTVAYQVVSTDGHTVKGSYEFTVDDPAPALGRGPVVDDPEAPESLAPSPAPSSQAPSAGPEITAVAGNRAKPDDTGSTIVGFVVGIVVALAAGAAFLYIRRRKA